MTRNEELQERRAHVAWLQSLPAGLFAVRADAALLSAKNERLRIVELLREAQ